MIAQDEYGWYRKQPLPTISIENVEGQQMWIRILILGFKGLIIA